MNTNAFHVSVYVDDIDKAVADYSRLLGIEPAKVKHDYAKFELEDPPVVFSLNVGGEPGALSHFGIRYGSSGELATERIRLKNGGVETLEQADATCCYASAEKVWALDGSGVAWELYAVTEADVETETAADPELRELLGQSGVTGRLKTG